MDKTKKEKQGSSQKLFKKKANTYINSTVQTKVEEPHWNTCNSYGLKKYIKKRGNSNRKEKRGNSQQSNSISHLQYLGASNFNNRCFTQSFPIKGIGHYEGFFKADKNIFSPQRKTFQKENTRKSIERLSLNICKKRTNHSEEKHGELNLKKGALCMTELQKQRRDIQKDIKRAMDKQKIEKKEVLKITQKYEKLIDRIAFSEMVSNEDIEQFDTKYFADSTYSPSNQCSDVNSMATVRQTKENFDQQQPSKSKACPGLQLKILKKMKIQDYNDQFMSHYDELSESWKRELAVQRRY